MTPEFPNIEAVLNKYSIALVQSLASKGIKQTSNLSQSVELKQTIEPLKTIYEVLMNEYWYYIDQGRGATEKGNRLGEVREAIKKWIQREGIKAEERNGRTPTEDQLAYLITRKIHKEGFPGRDFVSAPFEQFEQEITEALLLDLDINLTTFANRIFD